MDRRKGWIKLKDRQKKNLNKKGLKKAIVRKKQRKIIGQKDGTIKEKDRKKGELRKQSE